MKRRNIKHKHGTPNPILAREEEGMIAAVDKALAASANPQIIGRNGELPLVQFLNRHLPYTMRALTGHFIAPDGELSPQIDVLIVDPRYPLLAQHLDGSVLAMLHSVLRIIEVKTKLRSGDIKKAWTDARLIQKLASQVPPKDNLYVRTNLFSYRAGHRLDTLEERYIEFGCPDEANLDSYVLRLPEQDQPPQTTLGVELHFEPISEEERDVPEERWMPTTRPSYTILSDLYYQVVQDSYYELQGRDYAFGDIGRHVNDYMSWSTYRGEQYAAERDP